jgi:crotonobetaine/carnitine-CoA ligase
MNLRTYWETKVQKNPSKIFLYHKDEKIPYSELDRIINQVGNGLIELGVKKGDRICLMLPNIPEFLYCWFGLLKIGGVLVPINTNFKANEAQYVVNHSEATGLVVSAVHLQLALQIRQNCPHLKWIACVGLGENQLPRQVISFHRLFSNTTIKLKSFDLKEGDLACVIYTSGTMGFPKGVMHAHKNLLMTGEAFLVRAQVKPSDRIMAVLPLFHINAQFYSTWGAIAGEASLILIPQFSASQFWRQAVRYGATEFNFVGTIGRILCSRPEEEFCSEHTLRIAIGAGITPDVYETFTKRFKIPNVIDAYGLTEIPAVSQNPIGGIIKMKSIGLPARHPNPSMTFSEMKVLGEDGQEARPGMIGELVVRSPVMTSGYFKDAQKTNEAICNGWFYTGDYAHKDDDGYFYFVDRKRNIIRKKGENISAAEVEAAINEYPKVLESAVIAVPAELGEDEVMVFIVPMPGQSMTAEELIDWCKDRLASFKLPRFIQFRESLPKTSTQRIAKSELKKEKDLVNKATDVERYKKGLGL